MDDTDVYSGQWRIGTWGYVRDIIIVLLLAFIAFQVNDINDPYGVYVQGGVDVRNRVDVQGEVEVINARAQKNLDVRVINLP